jgi:hypothetical protein
VKGNSMSADTLSEKVIMNLQRNQAARNKESRYVKLEDHEDIKIAESLTPFDKGLPRYGEIVLKALTQPPKIREGVQITEINLCDRQKIFQLTKPKSQTPQNVVRTATGTALHIYAQRKIKNPDPSLYDVELLVEHDGWIFGTIDFYDREFDVVVDIKTKLVENEGWEIKPFSSHEQQLKDLMALKKARNGVLVYLLIGCSSKSYLEFYYEMNEYELQLQLKNLEKRAASFLNAKKQSNPALAENVFFNKGLNWLCHRIDKKTGNGIFCRYYWDCFTMIKEEKEKEHKDDSVAIPDDDLVDTSNYETEDPGLNMQSHQTIDLIKEEVGKI